MEDIPVVRIVLRNSFDDLILRNSQRAKWNFTGGRINGSETLEDACIRKTKEETGVDVLRDSLVYLGTSEHFPRGENTNHFINNYFQADWSGQVNINSIFEYRWISQENFSRIGFENYNNVIKFLSQLKKAA